LKVPPDVWKWVRAQAAERRMPVGNYVLELLRRGILDETVDQTVARLTSAASPAMTQELLRQVLFLRFALEAHLGKSGWTAVQSDAALRAEEELRRILDASRSSSQTTRDR
jgi:hypothetical protein